MSQVNNQELFKENKNDSQQKNPIVFTAEKKEIDQQIGLKSNVSLPSVNGNAGADAYISRYPGDDYADIFGIDTYATYMAPSSSTNREE